MKYFIAIDSEVNVKEFLLPDKLTSGQFINGNGKTREPFFSPAIFITPS
jgi:hypothetical protein